MAKKRKLRQGKAPGTKLKRYKGTIEITRSGMGYVTVDELQKDVMIRPQHFGQALHGDTVELEITRQKGAGKAEGHVLKVIHRKQVEFIGQIQTNKHHAWFIPDTERPTPEIYIPGEAMNGAKDGEQVIVRLTQWDEKKGKPYGEVKEVLRYEKVNDIAMKQILMQSGFPLSFSEEALEEAARISDHITADELKKRKDFREVLTFTIDPKDARDFDDALSVQKLSNGDYEIGVHIADVSHFVIPGTVLDEEAFERATSVYLPDRVLPMLPEKISNELCSLRPKEDKYTFSAVFQLNAKAELKNSWIGRTVIHSDHRFTYEDVQEIIEGKEGVYAEELILLNGLAQTMRKERFREGAINFSSQEVRFVLDEEQRPVGIVVKESKEAHQLIEEFMLLANKHVAEYLGGIKVDEKPVPVPYRVHDQPDQARLAPFVSFARKYGHGFDLSSPIAVAKSFNQMLKDVHGKPEQHVLETLGIRTMAKAVYTTENIGHYGLGFEHYCHFTSPIRRYPDVLVHRILQECLDNKAKPDKKLEKKCKHCSERERAAMESERSANKYKQVEYMSGYLGEEFPGVVSGVAAFGFWVETIEHKCEGLVSLYSLVDLDDFRYVEEDYCLVGKRSGRSFRIGDKVNIRVIAANLEKRQLDYELVIRGEKQKAQNDKSKVRIKKF
jgi:ribonuclease R